jgi:hypothetical protein
MVVEKEIVDIYRRQGALQLLDALTTIGDRIAEMDKKSKEKPKIVEAQYNVGPR